MSRGFIRKIYSDALINKIEAKLRMMGKTKLTPMAFQNMRVITTIIAFFVALYTTDLGYVFGPLTAIIWYYGFYYILIEIPISNRSQKLNREALDFFEILTITL